MLKILPQNKLEFEDMQVNLGANELPKFLLANLSEQVDIAQGVTVVELLHLFFHIREFITDYCCEDYFTVNAVFSALELEENHNHSYVEGYKELVVSHSNELISPLLVEFKTQNKKEGPRYFRDLEVKLRKEVVMKDHNGNPIKEGLVQHFSLLELVSLFFEELYHIATNTSSELTLVKM